MAIKNYHEETENYWMLFGGRGYFSWGYIGENKENLIESMHWDPCYLLVLRVRVGLFGILLYQEYASRVEK